MLPLLPLPPLPPSWKTQRLKYFATYSLSSVDRRMSDITVNVCHYPDAYHKEKIHLNSDLPTGTCTEAEHRKFSLKQGDILITKDSESPHDIGIPCLIAEDLPNTVCGYHLGIIRCRNDICPGFVFRFLQSALVKGYFFGESSGTTRFALGKSAVRNLEVPLPPLAEQKLISRYLDKKATQIDALVEKLHRKIELLKEQQTARINQTVTRGINLEAEMKDSGIDWIAEIPKHWEVKKFRFVSIIETGNTPSKSREALYFTDDANAFPWLRPGDLAPGFKGVSKSKTRLTAEGKKQARVVAKHSILLCCIGSTSGKCSIANRELATNQQINSITFNNQVLPRYGLFYMDVFGQDLLQRMNVVTLPILSRGALSQEKIIIPPIHEQEQIILQLDQFISQQERAIESAKKRISLLTEYRQALISSLVTGKSRVKKDMSGLRSSHLRTESEYLYNKHATYN